MKFVTRTVQQIYPEPEYEESRRRSFTDYLDASAIVLLGDPGIGKTTEFEHACALEQSAEKHPADDFLTLATRRFKGKTLYIDALDEFRSQDVSGREVLNRIRGRLDELENPKFRISCRIADWGGKIDTQSLAKVSRDESIVVLKLNPLTDDDIAEAISDEISEPQKFLDEARSWGLGDLLFNPQTLELLIEAVYQGHNWPSSRMETFELAI
ncbi:MAG TPA: hypothetical protein PKE26_00305 [Kiritimatiellia bacterium]|nr:hypothetical protein [Kiritimatiellia bacterium]HMO97536.1 hypothetical protein [Kiritimatiellia bacterium]HMP91057.1 hypothetical protein [Kiritimatiellia bacterium]